MNEDFNQNKMKVWFFISKDFYKELKGFLNDSAEDSGASDQISVLARSLLRDWLDEKKKVRK